MLRESHALCTLRTLTTTLWWVRRLPSSLAKGYDPLPFSSPLADWDKISETQGKDFYWLQSKLAASNQKAPITWSRVNVESVCKQFPRVNCATSLYITKHTTIFSDNLNVFNQLIEVPVYVSCTNAWMLTYIFVSGFAKWVESRLYRVFTSKLKSSSATIGQE